MDILVNVTQQKLRVAANYRNVVSGSQRFVRFIFNFDDGWDNLLVFAQFIQDDHAYNVYLDNNNSCYLPPEIVPGDCRLTLYGTGGTVIATTSNLLINIEKNALVRDGQSTEITLSLYEQLVNMVGSPLVAQTASQMTDTSKIYVYTGSESGYVNGNWYYYNSSSWVSGGVYNSVAVDTDTTLSISGQAADSKAVGDAISNLDAYTFTDSNTDGNIVITKSNTTI